MKIERISDNQIRCTLTSLDLSSRGINLAELAYGSEKARNLFREMIQQAAQEVGFEAEDIPLMVEAIPLSSESIMLIVTKVEDPEELDTRFSKFSPFAEAESENLLSQLADEFLEGAGDLAKLLGQNGTEELKANVNTAAENTGTENAKAPQIQLRTFRFDSLDQISEAAKAAGDSCDDIHNALYKKPSTRQYYLVLNNKDCNELDFSRVCNVLAEYAAKLPNEYAGEAYYKEHYELMIGEKALQKLKNAHKSQDLAAIDTAMAEINTVFQTASAEMYAQGGAQGGAQAGPDMDAGQNAGQDNSKHGDNVQDADFEEVK